MKDKITTFDLNAAFKALDDIEMPKSEGLKPQKAVLDEALSILPKTDCLLEDYYDVRSGADLRAAEEERRNEVAQAKLDRIEKIIDLDAKTPEDLQGSYAGKIIIQCPQCMELFYKKEEDLVVDEDDPTLVNVGEKCQHCGNTSGYVVIGKVGEVNVAEDEAKEQAAEEPAENAEEPELSDASILGVDPVAAEAEAENDEAAAQSEEAPEETPEGQAEEQAEEPIEGSEEPAEESEEPAGEEPKEEEEEDKKKEESLNNSEVLKGAEKDEMHSDNLSKNLTLNEEAGKDLDKQLKLHNEYIDYLQKAIKQEEDALKEVENEEIKAAIQRRLDGFKEDLQAALPEAVKDNLPAEDEKLPEPGEVDVDADSVKADEGNEEDSPVEESLNKSELLKKAEKDEMHTDLEPENKSLNESGLAEASEVSDSEIEELFNSDEFKTPISDSEVERIIAADKNESFKLEDLEDVDDQMLEKCITESLTSVYENVAGFKLGDCSMSNGKLIVEGKINFKSGKSKNTKYIFEQADRARKTILLNGLNESFGKDSSFKLTAKLTEGYKKLAPTKLSYEYKINGDVVTGEAK